MGFFKTLITGYKVMFQEFNTKHNDLIPRCFTGCGAGLMMIGSAIAAKTALKEDVQQVIAEADAAVEEARKPKEGEKKIEQKKRVFKAKAAKGWKIVKTFHKPIICETLGSVGVGVGYGMAEKGKHRALKAAGSAMAAFAAYRANVRNDLGDEADARYMSGRSAVKKTEKINKKTGEVTNELSYVEDDEGVTIKKNPNSFRLLYSPDTCPQVCSRNYHLRLNQIKSIQDNLTIKYQTVKHISLNDMRREFGNYIAPEKMDVDEGGIFGRVIDPKIPLHEQRINLHYEDDKDFMEGRKDWCYVIFDCEVIVGKINQKLKQVED